MQLDQSSAMNISADRGLRLLADAWGAMDGLNSEKEVEAQQEAIQKQQQAAAQQEQDRQQVENNKTEAEAEMNAAKAKQLNKEQV